MFIWLFCGGDNKFVHYIFNPMISIHWTIVFTSAITKWYDPFACFGDSFSVPFNYLVCIFNANSHTQSLLLVLVTRLMCLLIIWFAFSIQTHIHIHSCSIHFHSHTDFNRILLSILWSLLNVGKCLSNKQKNIFTTFVVTFLLNSGLSYIIFTHLLLFWICMAQLII